MYCQMGPMPVGGMGTVPFRLVTNQTLEGPKSCQMEPRPGVGMRTFPCRLVIFETWEGAHVLPSGARAGCRIAHVPS